MYGWGDDHHLAYVSYDSLPAQIVGQDP